MRKGMKLLCLESGKICEISYIDNEKTKVMVCVSGKLYPVEVVWKKFKLIK